MVNTSALKWYFAVSQASFFRADHDWPGLIKAAIKSATLNTSYRPHMIYDGDDAPFVSEVESMGVKIIRHRVSFYDSLEADNSKNKARLAVAAGAFLRFDIPLLEKEDEFVLYTDCDIVFLKELNFGDIAPPVTFAATSQFSQKPDEDMNSGVMLINIPEMRLQHNRLVDFTRHNLNLGLDQEVLRVFYAKNYSVIDRSLNWKPYWGINSAAQVLHWHGPKPATARQLVSNHDFETHATWKNLFNLNPASYAYYLGVWDAYSGIQHFKNGGG